MNQSSLGVLVMAGGTGGHIYPALAVAKDLQQRGYRVRWLGSVGGMEQELVSREGLDIDLLPVSGVRGKGKLALLKAPFVILKCVLRALKVLRDHQITLVLGFGGFASGPGGLAAAMSGRKLMIHEQNAIAGMTNRMLAKVADIVCEAFPGAFAPNPKVHTVGNPLRQSLLNLHDQNAVEKDYRSSDTALKLLIVGGSRGAQVFNHELPKLLAEVMQINSLKIMHQTGKGNRQSVEEAYQSLGLDNVSINEFIHDMDRAYAWADVIICRAGALTVSEVAVMGLPAIFVPYPYAVDDHQTQNAESLANNGAAVVIQQDDIKSIVSVLNEWLSNREQLASMSEKAKQLAVVNAKEQIVAYCQQLIGEAA